MKKNKDEDLVSWMRSDAKLADDHLEDGIMEKILRQPSILLTKQKEPTRSRDIVIVAYCILTLVSVTWCLFDVSIFTHFDMPDSNWHPTAEDQARYYWMAMAAAILSALSFVNHWLQSRKAHINRHGL